MELFFVVMDALLLAYVRSSLFDLVIHLMSEHIGVDVELTG